jgi:hypothetical protein
MSIKRLWGFTTAVLVAAASVASTPALPQVSHDLQETCTRQAETVFRDKGYSKDITRPKGDESDSNDVIANFESHYNTVLDRCFVLLEIFGVGASGWALTLDSAAGPVAIFRTSTGFSQR